jgi:aminopeptidase N
LFGIVAVHSETGPRDRSFRLPVYYKPVQYDVHLTFDTNNEAGAQDGVVKMHFKVLKAAPKPEMYVHANELQILSAKLCSSPEGECNGQALNVNMDSNKFAALLSMKQGLANPFAVQDATYAIEMKFKWKVRQSGGASRGGAFRSRGKYYAITQGEQIGIRKIFPCMDEPNLKAKFQTTISVLHRDSDDYPAVSNMPVKKTIKGPGKTTTVFELSPPMSTYLFAFAIPYGRYKKGVTTKGKTMQSTVYGSSYGNSVGTYVTRAVNFFNNYFGAVDPMPKIDYATNFDFLAMENWGMIYGASSRSTVLHEVAHAWFGNQVTCDWWRDIWLNEGWTAYATALSLTPLGYGNTDRQLYSLSSSVARRYRNYATPLQSDSLYIDMFAGGQLVYTKGGAIARMATEIVGGIPGSGKRVGKYLLSKRYQNHNSQSLAKGLANGDKLIEEAIVDFATLGGLPRLHVSYDNSKKEFVFTQSSQLSKKPNQRWTIPIFYAINGKKVQTPAIFPKAQKEFRLSLQSGKSASDYKFNPNMEVPMSVSGTFGFAATPEERFEFISDAEVESVPEPTFLPSWVKNMKHL